MTGFVFDTIDRLTDGRIGTHDVPCPLCGPFKSPRGQRRNVLRIWRIEPGAAGYRCARCGESGYVREQYASAPDPVRLAEAAERDRAHKAERFAKARWLWSRRKPIAGTIAETYLRVVRGYGGPLPATVALLPANPAKGFPPAMIAAFGLAHETEPGVIAIADCAVHGVHLTRLLPDGSDRERGDCAKIMIGSPTGSPLVLAPPGDMAGLAITEGIEDALTMHEAIGLGAWAAGCASRLPALADAVPDFVESVTIVVDDDADGRRHGVELARRIRARGIEVSLIVPNRWRGAA